METGKRFGPGLWPLAVRWQLDVNRENNMGIPMYVSADLGKLWKAGGTQLPPIVKEMRETTVHGNGLKSSSFKL
jgi:hypothetical protein